MLNTCPGKGGFSSFVSLLLIEHSYSILQFSVLKDGVFGGIWKIYYINLSS